MARTLRMRILWVTPQMPCLRSGGQVRQYHLIRHLAAKHRISVISLLQCEERPEVAVLREMGVDVDTVDFVPLAFSTGWANRLRAWSQLVLDAKPKYALTYPLNGLRQKLGQAIDAFDPDIIQLEHLFTAPLSIAAAHRPWVLQEHNLETWNVHSQQAHISRASRRLAGRIEEEKLCRWERHWIQSCRVCMAVSESDAVCLREWAPNTSVFVIPNGVDTTSYATPEDLRLARSGLVFFGNLGYSANADGLAWFCRDVLPQVKSQKPDTVLTIIGPNAPASVIALGAEPGIHYLGYVPDVRPHLWKAAVCVVPLRGGGGTRLKILESLAAGCPVVSTSVGAEGLDVGREVQLADTPQSFAAAVVRTLDDEGFRQRLALVGQQLVREKYDWSGIAPKLEQAYEVAIEAHRRR